MAVASVDCCHVDISLGLSRDELDRVENRDPGDPPPEPVLPHGATSRSEVSGGDSGLTPAPSGYPLRGERVDQADAVRVRPACGRVYGSEGGLDLSTRRMQYRSGDCRAECVQRSCSPCGPTKLSAQVKALRPAQHGPLPKPCVAGSNPAKTTLNEAHRRRLEH